MKIKNLVLSLTLLVGLSFLGITACSTGGNVNPPNPIVNSNTIAAIVNLVIAFGGNNVVLTPAQMTTLEAYLSSTTSPDVLIIVQMLAADGVIPTNSVLSSAQLAAIIGLLDTLGFNPVMNGKQIMPQDLAPVKSMPYSHN